MIKHSTAGSTLLAVLFTIAVMAILIGAVFMITTGEARLMQRSVDRESAIAYADGQLEYLYDKWRIAITTTTDSTQHQSGFSTNELMNGTATSPATTVPAGLPLTLSGTSTIPLPTGVTVASWKVSAADQYMVPLSSGTSRPSPEAGTNSRLRVRTYYVASVTMNLPRGGTVTVQRVFTRAGRNIFDNFLFSAQPVTEIHPGAGMYIGGTVYAGGDLYTASSNLNFQQDVSYTGNWYKNYKGGADADYAYTSGNSSLTEDSSFWDSRYSSTGSGLSTPNYPSNDPPHQGSQQKLLDIPTSSLNPNFTDDPASNNVVDTTNYPNGSGYAELISQVSNSSATDPLQIDTDTSERLANNADYRILIDASNNVTIYQGDTSGNYTQITGSSTGNALTAYTAIAGSITTNTTLKDGRENDNVRVVNVDMGALTTAINSGSSNSSIYAPVNGSNGVLLYINDTSAGTSVTTKGYTGYKTTKTSNGNYTTSGTGSVTSSKTRGIRLVNGGKTPTDGITIASPNPVYIQGDFNSGATTNYVSGTNSTSTSGTLTVSNLPTSDGSSAYPSGTSNPDYTSGTYQNNVAVVAADAVTILSNSWSDGNSANSLSSRTPTNTTVNAAIVAGNVPTTSSAYSGGIENFPRLLENWNSSSTSNGYLTIHGAFALLYDSRQATGSWNGNVYGVPSRRWFFDSNLQTNNPPGFPVAYSYDRGPWSTR